MCIPKRRSETFIKCTYCRFYCLIKFRTTCVKTILKQSFNYIKANPLKLRLIDLLCEDLGSKPILCQVNAVEDDNVQEEFLELRRDGYAKMLRESIVNLLVSL